MFNVLDFASQMRKSYNEYLCELNLYLYELNPYMQAIKVSHQKI